MPMHPNGGPGRGQGRKKGVPVKAPEDRVKVHQVKIEAGLYGRLEQAAGLAGKKPREYLEALLARELPPATGEAPKPPSWKLEPYSGMGPTPDFR